MRRLALVVAAAVVLSTTGCANNSATSPAASAAATATWAKSTGLGSSIQSLRTDLAKSKVELTSPTSTANKRHTICAAMLLDADQANSNLPAPDGTLSSLLSKAYGAVGTAADACYAAAANHAKLPAFNEAKSSALSYFAEAEARAQSLIGPGALPTGTTAPVESGV
jgi:hypothetical protein